MTAARPLFALTRATQSSLVTPTVVPSKTVSSELDQLLQAAPIGILYSGLEGGILYANPVFCRLTGYTLAQLRHLDYHAISDPEDFAKELRLIQQVCQGWERQATLSKRFFRRDGSILWTEVTLSLQESGEAGDESYFVIFVTDQTIYRQAEQEIHQRQQREALLSEIAAKLRTTLEVPAILNIAVNRLKTALDTDRVLTYQLMPDSSGVCVAEAVDPLYPTMLSKTFTSDCIPPPYLEAYRQGRLWATPDVQSLVLTDCHQRMLQQMQVRGMVAVAIQLVEDENETQSRFLWGLLIAHHCRTPRCWTQDEQQLMQSVGNQIAIALKQSHLLHQLQGYAQELEERVSQRTYSLERALKFEQLIRNLTETLRKVLHEDQVLQAAIEGLVQTLEVDYGYAGLFHEQQQTFQIRYESGRDAIAPSRMEPQVNLHQLPESCRQQLLSGNSCVCNTPFFKPPLDAFISAPSPTEAIAHLLSPILDDQGLLGIVALVVQSQPRQFSQDEIKLVEQVANQCSIAIRQSRLYRQEHAARLSADYFRQFLEQSRDIFVEYDANLRYLSINPAGCNYWGQPATAIVGKTNREVLGSLADNLDPPLQQALLSGEPVFVNYELSLPKGNKIFETVYTPIPDPDGVVQRVIGVSRDITDFKQQWQKLETQNYQLTETTRLKEEFIATTSHELRTPLTAIMGFSNVLLQEFFGKLNDKQRDYLERIHGSGQHLLDLINDILDLSRIEADRLDLELQLIFINDIYENVISLIQERAIEQSLKLEIEIEPGLEYVVADPRRLRQMLLNLLTNAVKFTTEGCVGLRIFRSKRNQNSANFELINFAVWDTGVGIDEADHHLLFSPFSQLDSSLSRKHQGTGLGLVITHKLAELHGGTVTVQSKPGQGSLFTISLPLREPGQFLLWSNLGSKSQR